MFTKSFANDIARKVMLGNHFGAGVVQDNNGVGMGRNFSLECLMFLYLCLQVCRIFVALVWGCLELLVNPSLEFVCISFEILELKHKLLWIFNLKNKTLIILKSEVVKKMHSNSFQFGMVMKNVQGNEKFMNLGYF